MSAPDDNHTSDGRCKYPKSCVLFGHKRESETHPVLGRMTWCSYLHTALVGKP